MHENASTPSSGCGGQENVTLVCDIKLPPEVDEDESEEENDDDDDAEPLSPPSPYPEYDPHGKIAACNHFEPASNWAWVTVPVWFYPVAMAPATWEAQAAWETQAREAQAHACLTTTPSPVPIGMSEGLAGPSLLPGTSGAQAGPSLPPVVQPLTRRWTESCQAWRIRWSIPVKRLKSNERQAVSQDISFDCFGGVDEVIFRIMLKPQDARGESTSFSKSKGRAIAKLKCESTLRESLKVKFCFQVDDDRREPVCHDFSDQSLAGLDQIWDLLSFQKPGEEHIELHLLVYNPEGSALRLEGYRHAVPRGKKTELPDDFWENPDRAAALRQATSSGGSRQARLGIDFGGVICRPEREREEELMPDCIKAVSKLVKYFGADHVFIVSKAGPTMANRSTNRLAEWRFYQQTGARDDEGHRYYVSDKPLKKKVVEALQITHFIDDRWSVLKHIPQCTRYLFSRPMAPDEPPDGVSACDYVRCGPPHRAWRNVLVDLGLFDEADMSQIAGLDEFLTKCGEGVAAKYNSDQFNAALGGFDDVEEMFDLITTESACKQYLGKFMNSTDCTLMWNQIQSERSRLALNSSASASTFAPRASRQTQAAVSSTNTVKAYRADHGGSQIAGLDEFLSKCGAEVAAKYNVDDFNAALGGFDDIVEMFELIASRSDCEQYLGLIMNPIDCSLVWNQIEIERSRLGLSISSSAPSSTAPAAFHTEVKRRGQPISHIRGLDGFLRNCGQHVAEHYSADDFNSALGDFDDVVEMFDLITTREECLQCLGAIMSIEDCSLVWNQIAVERSCLGLDGA